MDNFDTYLNLAKKSLNNIRGIFDKENIDEKLKELEKISNDENFWKDRNLVKKPSNKKFLENILNSYKKLNSDLENLKDLFDLATQENEEETIQDCIKKVSNIFLEIKKTETNCFLSGENDNYDIYLEIHVQVLAAQKAKTGQTCSDECT